MYITDLTRFLDKSGAIGPMLYPWILTFVGVGVHLIDGAAARLVNDSFRRE